MAITHWPKEDRPREKLLQKGAESLTDAELIAIFLQTGVRGKTALDMAKELLLENGSLKTLLDCPIAKVKRLGIGNAKLARLFAARELGKRYCHVAIKPGDRLNDVARTFQFLGEKLGERPHEVFACLYLDSQLKLLEFAELFHGTINQSSVYPREIVKRGLACNAASVILAHNHPSGVAKPSQADIEITEMIANVLAIVDIDLLDHVIIARSARFSFAEAGLLR